MIFVDNSGADIILGILPFVREMLRLGMQVLLCPKTIPSFSCTTEDITVFWFDFITVRSF